MRGVKGLRNQQQFLLYLTGRRDPSKTEGANEKKSNQEEKGHRKDNCESWSDLPTCDSTYEVFFDPQETPFLSSIIENLENTTVDQPADDSQSIILEIQIENERLRKEIHQVTTLKENYKLEVEKWTRRISVLEARVFTIDRFESDKDVTFYTIS